MTWSIRITKNDGELDVRNWDVCRICKHEASCYIPKAAHTVGSMLTSIDKGCDGHMAGGLAKLQCAGFEEIEKAEAAESPG
jgi:hypothetical protein